MRLGATGSIFRFSRGSSNFWNGFWKVRFLNVDGLTTEESMLGMISAIDSWLAGLGGVELIFLLRDILDGANLGGYILFFGCVYQSQEIFFWILLN